MAAPIFVHVLLRDCSYRRPRPLLLLPRPLLGRGLEVGVQPGSVDEVAALGEADQLLEAGPVEVVHLHGVLLHGLALAQAFLQKGSM